MSSKVRFAVVPRRRASRVSGLSVIGAGLLGLSILAGGIAADAETLSVAQSIEIALASNPGVRIAQEEVRKTAADIRQASAEGMPKLTLSGTYTRLDNASAVSIPDYDLPLAALNSRAAALVLTQPLDVFGIIKMGRRMAHLGRISAQYDYDRVKNDTIFQTKQAYYNVLRTQQMLRVQTETVRQLEAHLSDAQANYNAGTVAKFDVLRADTELANAKADLSKAQNAVRLAKSAFNNTLGRSLDTQVEVEEPGTIQYANLDLGKCIETALKSRPEVMNADTQVELSDKMIVIAQRGSKPRINLQWKINRNFTPTLIDPLSNNWIATLTTLLSLYDGGYNRSQVNQAAADANNAKSGKRALVLGVSLETKQAFLAVKEARERIDAAGKGLETAREGARLTEVAYQGGTAKQVDVLDAQAAQTLAETYQVTATYDYLMALARLEQAVGGQAQMASLIQDNVQNRQVASR